METSKWYVYDAEIISMLSEFTDVQIAQKCLKTMDSAGKNKDVNTLRNYVARIRKRMTGIVESCEAHKTDPTTVKHLWKKDKESSIFIKNPNYKEPEVVEYEKLQAALIEDLKKYSPKFEPIQRQNDPHSYLLVIDPDDFISAMTEQQLWIQKLN